MRPRAGEVWACAVGLLGVAHIAQNALAFVAYQQKEVYGFEGALASIPRGANVVGLMYARDSAYVGEHPFMHYVAYCQAEHGGTVEYSFAETSQSPFYYVSPENLPKVNLGYGWTPQASNPQELASYFECVLSRGDNAHLRRVARHYNRIYQLNRWAVWKRR